MRTVFESTHDSMRITGFEYENKYSIKYEQYHLEQWFKFRDGAIDSIETLKTIVAPQLAPGVAQRFVEMLEQQSAATFSANGGDETQFPTII